MATELEVDLKRGARRMGVPARPTAHPENHRAAHWSPRGSDEEQYAYVLADEKQRMKGIHVETSLESFNNWSLKAHHFATNLWHALKTTGPSKKEAAWQKLELSVKAISRGGFESLYKQTFPTEPNEKLKDSFACYLSTTTGPVAGTLFISNSHIAFCSDRPLSLNAPSGQQLWSYYKIMIPSGRISSVSPVTLDRSPSPEKYIEIDTIDGHEFWFMGFINYDKAYGEIQQTLAEDTSSRLAGQGI